MKRKTGLLILCLVLLAAACGSQCAKDDYMALVEPLVGRWDDAAEIASNSARISLGPAIAALQDIRREAAGLDVPDCGADAHRKLLDYMDVTVDAYVAFLGQEDEAVVARHFERARDRLSEWGDLLQAIGE